MRSKNYPSKSKISLFQDFPYSWASTISKTLHVSFDYLYQMATKSIIPSKADLSDNWRACFAKKPVPTTLKSFSAFRKKTHALLLVNQYPAHPHLWSDFTNYSVGLKCELCRTNLRNYVFPQKLNACQHIFCAKCINDHYIVADNTKCPTCAVYIHPSDDPSYCDYYDDDESYHFRFDDRYEEESLHDEPCCPCASQDCPGGCGALPCGCIDTCRGRCEHRD